MKVNSIFNSYQGEGKYIGTRATFIRLSGCNLRCWFCDTEYTKYEDKTEQDIVKQIPEDNLVVITGGEPLLQDLDNLVKLLLPRKICIETNGTIIPSKFVYDNCFITCSPKGNWIIKKCDEVKVVNTSDTNLSDFDSIQADSWVVNPVEVDGQFNFKETIEKVKQGDKKWKIGIQLHKIYGIS